MAYLTSLLIIKDKTCPLCVVYAHVLLLVLLHIT